MIRISEYPQLSSICWSQPGQEWISEEDALAVYERNWPWVEQAELTDAERALIDRLAAEHGNGTLLV